MTQPGMSEIVEAIGLLQTGQEEEARVELLRLWGEWRGREGAMLQRTVLAHFLADCESDPAKELAWDLLALEAATGSSAPEASTPIEPGMAGFLPSLHLNAGDALRRLGDADAARRHAERGLAHAGALPQDGYGDTIRKGLERLAQRLSGEAGNP